MIKKGPNVFVEPAKGQKYYQNLHPADYQNKFCGSSFTNIAIIEEINL
jgi:hypothetical protein